VAVTFDDGLESILDNVLPELRMRSIPVTLFAVPDALGRNRAWEHRGGDDTRNERVMSREQLARLPSELVTIGSHSLTHAFLPTTDEKQLERELAGSRAELEKILDRPVKLFSFPYGGFNEQVIEGCRNAGYERVFTALPFRAFSRPGEFVTGRVGTAPTDWTIEFRLKLVGAYRWLPYAFLWKRRVLSVVRGRRGKSPGLKVSQKKVA
jgi:peptidoglycan/xylan/chitin deacetylase (PgdA/CDA1 family)